LFLFEDAPRSAAHNGGALSVQVAAFLRRPGLVSLRVVGEDDFFEILPSWNASRDDDFVLKVSLLRGGVWSAPRRLARWSGEAGGAGSCWHGDGLEASVDTLRSELPAQGFALRCEGRVAGLRRLAVSLRREGFVAGRAGVLEGAGIELLVPELSQRALPEPLGPRICSPTSLAMLLGFWNVERAAPAALAGAVLDRDQDLFGNWSLNVAEAGARGLLAIAAWLPSLEACEAELRAGRPLALSHRFAKGELSASPLASSAGHLLVLRGMTSRGDLIVNDPAADPEKGEAVRRVYPRAAFARSWDGLAYLMAPEPSL